MLSVIPVPVQIVCIDVCWLSRTNFSVESRGLEPLNGKVVSIFVNGTLVGNKTVAWGRIKLELTNQRGGSVPAVAKGTVVELKVGSALLMGGAF